MRKIILCLILSAPAWAQCGKVVKNPTTGKMDCVGNVTADASGNVKVGGTVVTDRTPGAMVSFTVDDEAYADWSTLFASKSINGTTWVITSDITTSAQKAALLAAQSAGWEIGSHTKTHARLATGGLSGAQLDDEIGGSLAALQSWGLNVQSIAYPYGEFTDTSRAITRKYYRAGRTVGTLINLPPYRTDAIYGYSGDDTTLATLEAAVDQALATGGWLCIMLHTATSPASPSPDTDKVAKIGTLIDYIKGKSIPILTFAQALDRAGNLVENARWRVGADGSLTTAGNVIAGNGDIERPTWAAKGLNGFTGNTVVQNGAILTAGQDLLTLGRPDNADTPAGGGDTQRQNGYMVLRQGRVCQASGCLNEASPLYSFDFFGKYTTTVLPRWSAFSMAQQGSSGEIRAGVNVNNRFAAKTFEVAGNILSSEMTTNGTFDTDTGWSKGTGWTIAGGVAHSDGTGSSANLNQSAGIKTQRIYRCTFTISNYVSGAIRLMPGGNDQSQTFSGNGTYQVDIPVESASANAQIYIQTATAFVGDIDNFSVKELTGGDALIRGVTNTLGVALRKTAFASLGTPSDGTIYNCNDCDAPATPGAACTSAGAKAGAEAHRVRGAWICF